MDTGDPAPHRGAALLLSPGVLWNIHPNENQNQELKWELKARAFSNNFPKLF